MKKIICVILTISFLISLIACSSEDTIDIQTTNTNVTTTPSNEPPIEYEMDDLPEKLNLDTTVRFLSAHQTGHNIEITVHEESAGDPVVNSVYYRELYLEERFGIEIENTITTPDQSFGQMVELQAASGEDLYQIISADTHALTGYIFNDYLVDLYSLDYFDFEKPWWSDSYIKAVELDSSLYVASGSLSLYTLRNMIVTYYNKAMAEKYGTSNADLLDIYNIVNRGDWTIDKMIELGADIYEDINGNSEVDENDIYGIGILKTYSSIDSFWSSFDIDILTTTPDGWYELNVDTDKLYSALEKLNALIHNSKGVTTDISVTKFPEDKLLFITEALTFADLPVFRRMPSDYGIIPFPKYNKEQKKYYSYSANPTGFSIPQTNADPNTAALVLEAMAAYAYRDTVPKYLDVALKGRYMNDPESRTMIDIIVNGLKYDASTLYGGTIGGGIQGAFRDLLYANKNAYASTYTKQVRNFENTLKTYKRILDMYK